MCCNNCCNSYATNNACSCYGSQNLGLGNTGGTRNMNFIVSARIAPLNPCYINPYTGCSVPYATSSCGCSSASTQSNSGCGCGCNNNCGCGSRNSCCCGWN